MREFEPVNPQWHDEFVALCALFPSGELTEEEWALLQVHLAYCDSCRLVFEQYQTIAADVIPALAANATQNEGIFGSSSFSIEAAEGRLMTQLEPGPVIQPQAAPRRRSWMISAGAIAASAVVAVGLVGTHLYHSKTDNVSLPATAAHVDVPKAITALADTQDIKPELERAQQRIAALQQQLDQVKSQFQQSNTTVSGIQQQLASELAERKTIREERDSLTRQLASVQGEAQSLRDKNIAMTTAASQQTSRTTALEARLHEANAALDEKDRMLTLDKEFLAHDREIRDLIGARNLYIADIFDVGQNGKTNKPFGRIFYTKDKSLVFYGYDLDKQSGLKQSVAFQAWGGSADNHDVSLGLFYQDDTHKRWVLRFNDTKTLAHLNKVFVTAEPQGGSVKPTGKPLLLAYLQIQPNHP
jgi:regulator of replication initiation timing